MLTGGESAYWASVDEASKALKENGRTLDLHTEKGRANRKALDDEARASLDYLGTIQAQHLPASTFNATLDQQRARLEATAIKFGMGKAAAHAYAMKILGIPHMAVTNVQLNASGAIQTIDTLNLRLTRFNGRTVAAYVRIETTGSVQAPFGVNVARAGGGIIPGQPSRHDNVLAAVATGEYVVNAGSTSRYRGTLDAINQNRYAAGGYVTARGPVSGGGVIQLEVVGNDRALVDLIRRLVRINGGNAQQAFGWN